MLALVPARSGIARAEDLTYAERLGWPAGARVVIFHVDDVGMSHDSNMGAMKAVDNGVATSLSIMMPCPWVPEFAAYVKEHPQVDAGVHLTLTSEWKNYRWGPVAGKPAVPGLMDSDGYLWHGVSGVVAHASADEFETEIRAQLDKALAMGIHPTHLDSHMGTCFQQPFIDRYVNVGIEKNIPILMFGGHMQHIGGEAGDLKPFVRALAQRVWDAGLPVIDDLVTQPTRASDYAARKNELIALLRDMKPGITQIIVHCTEPTEVFSYISGSGPSRAAELRLMTDPDVRSFIESEKIVLTTWRELKKRREDVGGVAIADIVEPFLTAHTATFKVTTSGEWMPGQELNGMFMEPSRVRQTLPVGATVIADLQQGKIVTLIPQAKQAVVVEVVNIPEDFSGPNSFHAIRNRILKAQPFDDASVEFLGQHKLDGQPVLGYRIQKPDLHATVWAHAETKMPVRIEVLDAPAAVAMSNIVFDVALDETLFSLDIPDGYTVRTVRQDLSEPTEEDLVASFRMWAKHMGGTFPSKMDRSAVNEFVKYQQEKMKEEGIEPSSDRMTQLQQTVIDMSHGFPFVEALPAESDWHYAGQAVEFGDAETPVFWYRPEGAATYRVIYGDLSVMDVAPEDLPK